MKASKTPRQLAKNASKLHKKVGELLTCQESGYKNFEIRQEYAVSRVNPEFKSNREKFDWVILGLKIVIEAMGIQHYKPICFGGMDITEAQSIFKHRQETDQLKQQAAEDAGWAYVTVRYDEKIDLDKLSDKITKAINDLPQERKVLVKEKKAIIQNKSNWQKPKDGYKWPSRKLESRPFPKKGK